MKFTLTTLTCLLLASTSVAAFAPVPLSSSTSRLFQSAVESSSAAAQASSPPPTTQDPLLIRAARGEQTERTPVWMMRQAGRHIKEYRDLCAKYPTFRMRSEIPEVAVEVSLQPWRNYKTDGCILFSDILTPLPGMGCEFTIDEKLGPLMEPCRSWDDIKKIHKIDPSTATPFVAETLKALRHEVDSQTAVLGFVGCPYTLATYIVEGKSSKEYLEIKKMAMSEPDLLHAILLQLADSIGDYACFQIEHGAQLIQIFDSWAGHLSPRDYDTFAAPYQKMVLDKVKCCVCVCVSSTWFRFIYSICAYTFNIFLHNRSRPPTPMSLQSCTLSILVHLWNAWQRLESMWCR